MKQVEKTVPVPVLRAADARCGGRADREARGSSPRPAPFNRIEPGSADLGFITSGISYQYVKEVFPEASVLKLGFTNPLPRSS